MLFQAKPGTFAKQYQKVCEDNGLNLLVGIVEWYGEGSDSQGALTGFDVYYSKFSYQAEDFWRTWASKDTAWVAANLNKPLTSNSTNALVDISRTGTFTVRTADPSMCTRRWCGVKGALVNEQDTSRGQMVERETTEEERPEYYYYHLVTHPSPFKWEKTTAFKFPVQRIDDSESCECKAMTQSYPPSHSGLVDAVLPSRDWIAPPTTSQTLLSDGKYSRDLCPAE
jgi:hypothetical protein